MVLIEHFHHDTKDVAHFRQRVEPFDDCTYLGAPPHTSWTLDVGSMSTYIVDIARWAIERERSPTGWTYYPLEY